MYERFQVKMVGYCSLKADDVLKRFLEDGPKPLLELEGDYVIVIENNVECYLISSTYAVTQYYYAVYEGRLFHGDTLIDILRESHMPWSWNWEALADLAELGNLIENETLHTQIHRVPNASILRFKDGRLEASSLSWEKMHKSFNGDPQEALCALNKSVRTWADGAAILSLSSGFDSRLILSSLLRGGLKPTLVSMGGDDCQDVIVPRLIASSLGLQHIQVELDLEDYLTHGKRIAYLTSGTKEAWHWHSYIYPLKANVSREIPFFVGDNGNFARLVYSHAWGLFSIVADLFASFSLRWHWRRTLRRILREDELAGMNPEFSGEFTRLKREERICRLVNLCHKRFVSGLERYFVEQTLRNFNSNGMKLFSASVSYRSPFFERGWVGSVWKLGILWKLGSRWHRWAIERNYPDLLSFPEKAGTTRMSRRPPLSYALPHFMAREKRTTHSEGKGRRPYAPYEEWFRSSRILGFVAENSHLLSDIMSRSVVDSVIEEQRTEGNRTAAIAFLLNLIFWKVNLKEVYGAALTPTKWEASQTRHD